MLTLNYADDKQTMPICVKTREREAVVVFLSLSPGRVLNVDFTVM